MGEQHAIENLYSAPPRRCILQPPILARDLTSSLPSSDKRMIELPSISELTELLIELEAIIGLSASCPQDSRHNYRKQLIPEERDRYEELWESIDGQLRTLRAAGFPFRHPNPHKTLSAVWGWSWTIQGGAAARIEASRELYANTIHDITAIKDAVGAGADAPVEILRELRESARRTNELFVIMAFRTEMTPFWQEVIEPAAKSLNLQAVRIDQQETEVAISEEILSAIRRALLVLCDLTFERPNCYFEAGFAKGSFRRVIFTARQDHNPRSADTNAHKVHFDLDQIKITWWDLTDLAAARGELTKRIAQVLRDVRADQE